MDARRVGMAVLAAVGAAALGRALGLPGLMAASLALLAMLLAAGAGWAFRSRRRRPAEDGFPYVFVEEDGGARELTADEREYLETEFHPADGGRPYIKAWYDARTPSGRVAGYLPRRQLPQHVRVSPAPPEPVAPGTSTR